MTRLRGGSCVCIGRAIDSPHQPTNQPTNQQQRRRLARALQLEKLEDRRVLASDLMLSAAGADGSSLSPQQLDVMQNIPEIRNWQAYTQDISAANDLSKQSAQLTVEQRLAQHAADARTSLSAAESSLAERPAQLLSPGTLSVSRAITQSLAQADWQSQYQTNQDGSTADLFGSLADGQPPANPLTTAGPAPLSTEAIQLAMAESTSASQLLGGQLITTDPLLLTAPTTGPVADFNQQLSDGYSSSQIGASALDLGIEPQAYAVSGDQPSQAIDGSLVASLFGSAQSTGTTASLLGEGEGGSAPSTGQSLLPQVDFPQLQFLQHMTDGPTSFIPPSDLVGFVDTRGSVDDWLPGSNWVHTVPINWTSESVWSYTEQLAMRYIITESLDEGGSLADLETDPESGGDPEQGDPEEGIPYDDRLLVEGTWSSSVNTLRLGYVYLTFHAFRGQSTATANTPLFYMGGGTRYTLSLDFADAVQMIAGVSASSTALIDPERIEAPGSGGGGQGGGSGSGNGGQPEEFRLPDDFTGSASASSSFSYMQVVMGTLDISSIPFWVHIGQEPEEHIVDHLIFADGTFAVGYSLQQSEDWSSASQSGDLERLPSETILQPESATNNPLAQGGREEVDYTALMATLSDPDAPHPVVTDPETGDVISISVPHDPADSLTGHGSASAMSSSTSSDVLSTWEGSWQLVGAQRQTQGNRRWQVAIGEAMDNVAAEIAAQGRVDGRVVNVPIHQVVDNTLIGGTSTYSGRILVGFNYKDGIDGNLLSEIHSTISADYDGSLRIVHGEEDQAIIDVSTNSAGRDFVTIIAKLEEEGLLTSSVPPTLTHNTYDFLYHVESVGKADSTAFSEALGQAPASAESNLKWEAAGIEFLHTADKESTRWDLVEQTLDDSVRKTLFTRFNENVDLTGVVLDDELSWSGTAERTANGVFDYYAKFDSLVPLLSLYDQRLAVFHKTVELTSVFNIDTQLPEDNLVFGGDEEVVVSGQYRRGFWWEGIEEGDYGPDDRTQYELALESIFANWDGGLPSLPDDEPPPEPDPEPDPPGSGNPPPSSSETFSDGLARWFGGRNGDRFDVAMATYGDFHSAWLTSYVDYVNPWNGGQEPVDLLDSALTNGTKVFQFIGVGAGLAASGVWLWGAVGGSTMSIALTPHAASTGYNVSFQVLGTWMRGTATGLIRYRDIVKCCG